MDAEEGIDHLELVFRFLKGLGSAGATNHEIAAQTGLEPQVKVYHLTKKLLKAGRIRGHRYGAIWVFYAK